MASNQLNFFQIETQTQNCFKFQQFLFVSLININTSVSSFNSISCLFQAMNSLNHTISSETNV